MSSGRVYNIAGGGAYSLLDLRGTLGSILGVEPVAEHADPRPGDIRHSQADVSAAARDLGFRTEVSFEEGLRRTVAWFASRASSPKGRPPQAVSIPRVGYCTAFGVRICRTCQAPMVAGRSSCFCTACETECIGRFAGCPDVWALTAGLRRSVAASVEDRPAATLSLGFDGPPRPRPPALSGDPDHISFTPQTPPQEVDAMALPPPEAGSQQAPGPPQNQLPIVDLVVPSTSAPPVVERAWALDDPAAPDGPPPEVLLWGSLASSSAPAPAPAPDRYLPAAAAADTPPEAMHWGDLGGDPAPHDPPPAAPVEAPQPAPPPPGRADVAAATPEDLLFGGPADIPAAPRPAPARPEAEAEAPPPPPPPAPPPLATRQPTSPSDTGAPTLAQLKEELDWVITTVVAANEGVRSEVGQRMDGVEAAVRELGQDFRTLMRDVATTQQATSAHAARLDGLDGRLAPLEAVPADADALRQAVRQEFEQSGTVLAGHDRAIADAVDRLTALAARLAAVEAAREEGARLTAIEARLSPLEPLPDVVQALRRTIRQSEEQLASEVAVRDQALAALRAQVTAEAEQREQALRGLMSQDLDRVVADSQARQAAFDAAVGRVADVETRLAPVDTLAAELEALRGTVRKELDALANDAQARDTVLRRALQNDLERLQAEVQADHQAGQDAARRFELLESRLGPVEALSGDVAALGSAMRSELEALAAATRAQEEAVQGVARRVEGVEGRMVPLDNAAADVAALRAAARDDAERVVGRLRAIEQQAQEAAEDGARRLAPIVAAVARAEDKVGQLAWVPGEFEEARKRINALGSRLKLSQDAVLEARNMQQRTVQLAGALGERMHRIEEALAVATERVERLQQHLGTAGPPPSG